MLKQFKTYQLSTQFYQACVKLKLPRHLRDQLLRASSFITLNLAILSLSGHESSEMLDLSDHIGACLYRLTKD